MTGTGLRLWGVHMQDRPWSAGLEASQPTVHVAFTAAHQHHLDLSIGCEMADVQAPGWIGVES